MSAVQRAPQLNTWSAEEWIGRMFLFEAWPHELDLSEAANRIAALALARRVALSGSIDQSLLAKAAHEFRCANDPGPVDPELVSPVQLNALARAGIITLDDAGKYWAEWAAWAAVDWGD